VLRLDSVDTDIALVEPVVWKRWSKQHRQRLGYMTIGNPHEANCARGCGRGISCFKINAYEFHGHALSMRQ